MPPLSTADETRPDRAPRSAPLSALVQRLRRPVASGTYRPEVDGLRFVAIAVVVFGHFMERATRFFPAAWDQMSSYPFAHLLLRPGMGVYLFFAVSGFILARQAMKAQASPVSATFLKSYFGRRILRIEPPYVILLVGTWLTLTLSGYTPDRTHHFDVVPRSLEVSLAGSIFYLHDLVWGTYPRLFPPGWSLEIEVQFYLLAPLLFWAFFRMRSTVGRILLGAAGLVLGAFVSLKAPAQIGPVHTSASLLQFFHFFWLGILIAPMHAWIVCRTDAVPSLVTGSLGWLGLVCYLAVPNAPDDNLAFAMAIRAITLASLLAMFVSVFANGSSFRAFCGRPWIALIGGACYSIYLTHLQVIQVMTSALAKLSPQAGVGLVALFLVIEAVAVVLVGLVFYALIERTFMLKDWPQRLWAGVMRGIEALTPNPQAVAGKPRSSREPS